MSPNSPNDASSERPTNAPSDQDSKGAGNSSSDDKAINDFRDEFENEGNRKSKKATSQNESATGRRRKNEPARAKKSAPITTKVITEPPRFEERLRVISEQIDQLLTLPTRIDVGEKCVNNEIKSLQSRIDSLQTRMDSFVKDAERIEKFLPSELSKSRYYTFVLMAIITIAFGANVIWQVYPTLMLYGREKELKDTIAKSDSTFNQRLTEIDKQLAQFAILQNASKQDLKAATDCIGTLYDVLGILNIGHQKLTEQNPEQSKYYAIRGLEKLDATLNMLKNDANMGKSLKSFRTPALILLAESEVRIGNSSEVLRVANLLAADNCDCNEKNHYSGLALLDSAVDENTDLSSRASKRKDAISRLEESARSDRRDNFDLVLLAAAQFDNGNFEQSHTNASKYFNGIANSLSDPEKQLRDRPKAQHSIAATWMRLADFVLDGKRDRLDFIDKCPAGPGMLGAMEGRIMERLFVAAKANRGQFVGPHLSDKRAQLVSDYCDKAIESVKQLTEAPCAIAPTSKQDSDVKVAPIPEPSTKNDMKAK